MADSNTGSERRTGETPTVTATAGENLGEAHQLLTRLKQRLGSHPELDAAIEKLEEVLSALNVQTGGML